MSGRLLVATLALLFLGGTACEQKPTRTIEQTVKAYLKAATSGDDRALSRVVTNDFKSAAVRNWMKYPGLTWTIGEVTDRTDVTAIALVTFKRDLAWRMQVVLRNEYGEWRVSNMIVLRG